MISKYAAHQGGFIDTLWKAMRRGLVLRQPDTVRYYLEKWLVICPHPERQALACLKAGLLLESGGYYQEAVELFRKGLQGEPDHPSLRAGLYSRLAFNLVQLGRPEEALRTARAAVELRPDQAGPRLHLGLALEADGQDPRAAEAYLAGMQVPVMERELFSRIRERLHGADSAEPGSARLPATLNLLAGIFKLAGFSGRSRFSEADLQARL